MKHRSELLSVGLTFGLAAFVLTGCGKKDTYVEPAPVYEPAPVVQAPVQEQAPASRVTAPRPTDADFDIRQVDTLVQQRRYEAAVDTMLRAQAAQATRQTDAQRLEHHARMRLLQQQVAQAMAAGDPEAQRAARLLQQYSGAQTRTGGR